MGLLNLVSNVTAYDDLRVTSNPGRVSVDWSRTVLQLPVRNAGNVPYTIAPGDSVTAFDGTRTTSIDGTTVFALTLNTATRRYRFTSTGGTPPAFRTARALSLTGIATTLTVQANNTVLVTVASGTPFGAVVVGDTVFLPSVLSGDSASPFNPINVGLWTVLGSTSSTLTLARPSGDLFAGITQTVTPSADSQFLAFSAAGVQVGDTVSIQGSFAVPVRRAFGVVAVTPSWFEVESTSPLAAESGVMPDSNMSFYTSAKRFLRVETDQECLLQLNGDTSALLVLTPWIAGDSRLPATFEKVGATWRLVLTNRSTVPLQALVISAE